MTRCVILADNATLPTWLLWSQFIKLSRQWVYCENLFTGVELMSSIGNALSLWTTAFPSNWYSDKGIARLKADNDQVPWFYPSASVGKYVQRTNQMLIVSTELIISWFVLEDSWSTDEGTTWVVWNGGIALDPNYDRRWIPPPWSGNLVTHKLLAMIPHAILPFSSQKMTAADWTRRTRFLTSTGTSYHNNRWQ